MACEELGRVGNTDPALNSKLQALKSECEAGKRYFKIRVDGGNYVAYCCDNATDTPPGSLPSTYPVPETPAAPAPAPAPAPGAKKSGWW